MCFCVSLCDGLNVSGAFKSTLCCAAATFMLFHYSLFLKFVNNFDISCQDNEFILKVEFTL